MLIQVTTDCSVCIMLFMKINVFSCLWWEAPCYIMASGKRNMASDQLASLGN